MVSLVDVCVDDEKVKNVAAGKGRDCENQRWTIFGRRQEETVAVSFNATSPIATQAWSGLQASQWQWTIVN